jgi:hypothetical protein
MGLHHPSAGDWHHLGRYGDCMFFWTGLMLQWRFFLSSHVLVQYLSHAYFTWRLSTWTILIYYRCTGHVY